MDKKEKRGRKYIGWWLPLTIWGKVDPNNVKYLQSEKKRLEQAGFCCSLVKRRRENNTFVLLLRKIKVDEIIVDNKDQYYSHWIHYLHDYARQTIKEVIETDFEANYEVD